MGIQQNSTIHGHVWWIQPRKKKLGSLTFCPGLRPRTPAKVHALRWWKSPSWIPNGVFRALFWEILGQRRRTSQNAFQAKIVSKFIEDFDLDVKISIKWIERWDWKITWTTLRDEFSPTMYNVPAHPNAPVVPGKKSLYSILPLLQWKLASTEPTWSRILGWESCILK